MSDLQNRDANLDDEASASSAPIVVENTNVVDQLEQEIDNQISTSIEEQAIEEAYEVSDPNADPNEDPNVSDPSEIEINNDNEIEEAEYGGLIENETLNLGPLNRVFNRANILRVFNNLFADQDAVEVIDLSDNEDSDSDELGNLLGKLRLVRVLRGVKKKQN